ncbi:unnamed protein product [Brachionus calyciflorus]|uniref:MULE transposase domain-containing protein n=1 Tax=Brachionus calyciflorus TaxID=104777 RepID=A0A813U6F0_9BILA|nr:unnamed protein product [Brachionus calyciflorus]
MDFETASIQAFKEAFPGVIIKGCHFHFTQALWKNIQKAGLSDVYSKQSFLYDYLNLFKSLAFVRVVLLNAAWYLINYYTPANNPKVLEFKEYFIKTWIEDVNFPTEMWNHYYNDGPRINNHVEGYNSKLNKYIDRNHPHIYSAIKTLKDLETTTGLNFYQRESGGLNQFPRRPNDI